MYDSLPYVGGLLATVYVSDQKHVVHACWCAKVCVSVYYTPQQEYRLLLAADTWYLSLKKSLVLLWLCTYITYYIFNGSVSIYCE